MQTLSSLESFYENGYWAIIALVSVVFAVRIWRVVVTWETRLLAWRVKGFVVEKMLKGMLGFALALGLLSVPAVILAASSVSLLVKPYQLYLVLAISVVAMTMELVLCFTMSRALLERYPKKGMLTFAMVLLLFVFVQFFAVALRTYSYPDVSESVLLPSLPVYVGGGERWLVFEGGGARHTNDNHAFASASYGSSIARLGEGGRFFKGEATSNEDFFGFGEHVLSSVSGRVVSVVDSLRDAAPSLKRDSSLTLLGNFVAIMFETNRFFVVSNLKHGSVKVRVGDSVKSGDEIAAIGNSSFIGMPQLRFHVQDKRVGDTTAVGLPVRFRFVSRERWLVHSKVQNEYLLRHDKID